MSEDPLQYLPVEKWSDLEQIFNSDWPRGKPALATLDTQKRWIKQGIQYNFKVHCPYGDINNGMVAINQRSDSYTVVIQCPTDNTASLEKSLRDTKLIDWKREIVIPFCSENVIECIKKVIPDDHPSIHLQAEAILNLYLFNKKTPFDNVSLPSDVTFGLLKPEHSATVNSTWPHRYPNSEQYLRLLIDNDFGYALFVENIPVTWVFVNEVGMFMHLYTIEGHRKKGYAELLYKLTTNILMRDNKTMYACVIKDNVNAQRLHEKVGFTKHHTIGWLFCKNKGQE